MEGELEAFVAKDISVNKKSSRIVSSYFLQAGSHCRVQHFNIILPPTPFTHLQSVMP
jgi:hypothetical protein